MRNARKKRILTYTLNDFAIDYANEPERLRKDFTKNVRLYLDVSKDIMKILSCLIIKGLVFKIPERLGFILIVKSKPKKLTDNIDFNKTKLLKRKVVFNNLHTKGFVFSFHWVKNNKYVSFTNQSYYKFRRIQDNKSKPLRLKDYILQCEEERRDYDAPEKSLFRVP